MTAIVTPIRAIAPVNHNPPRQTPYAAPLTPEQLAAILNLAMAADRLKRASSRHFMTHEARAQIDRDAALLPDMAAVLCRELGVKGVRR
jgi:hypothetical protein